MAHPPVDIVDEQDNVIGSADVRDIWRAGHIHRIVRIMAEDSKGRILLQKRSEYMDLFPGCWDHSAAGHVDAGETYLQAAERELREELGISGVKLAEIAHYRTEGMADGRHLNRFNKLYSLVIPSDTRIRFDKHEVSEVRWFTPDEIERLIAGHPEQVTADLARVMREYY